MMEKKIFTLSLAIAPLLYTASGFFWLSNGRYNVTGATLIVIGSVFWVFVFNGFFTGLKAHAPWYSAIGRCVAIYGCACGGVAFGLQDAFADMFHISHSAMLNGLALHPVFANLIFWIGGPLFPLSVFAMGIMLARTKMIPVWAGIVLSAAGVLFPVSRILRIEAIAHAVDLLMLVPMGYVAFRGVKSTTKPAEAQNRR
ncbi:hypothetical protein GWR56_11800 [Mucilaginibacter sp. 14171R-50]|uniref:hypothetical protein n=1 Tax=Mucilaginibacter sp. 14171R-50 TaxID=2703789 RepID=UPI00138CDA84|nr:hypothetical protein [Mucilaginibacter sp. 14171R-50]QHS56185.1 hypothetical protein GWR56_11800 [Mucilaginibacter sp. 14171R-50]